jgi:phosphatidylinositol alpha-1,6-mannosyltransferase
MSNVGGMQRVATELHEALLQRDDIAMRTIALRSSWKWVHVKAVPFLVSLAARLRVEVAWFRADTILFTSMTTALPLLVAGPALKRRGVRLAAIVHGLDVTDPNPAYQLAVRRLCKILDVVMPVSRATGDELVARGLAPNKVRVVPNAVDLSRFEGVSDQRGDANTVAVQGAPELPDDAFLIITVGRQVRRKGFAWFVDHVMPKLPDQVVFWLAGDGPERPEIDAAIARQRLGHRVRCLGKVSEEELVALYQRADLFIMPNIVVPGDMEGFGIVMLEAGACGLPTLAADLEGIRDVISEGVNGWFAPTGDADAFASRIETLLGDRRSLAEASRRTAEHVKKTFTWDKTAERYLEALRKTD